MYLQAPFADQPGNEKLCSPSPASQYAILTSSFVDEFNLISRSLKSWKFGRYPCYFIWKNPKIVLQYFYRRILLQRTGGKRVKRKHKKIELF